MDNKTTLERCCGCGIAAEAHPMVAVVSDGAGTFTNVPVCGQCHADPAHRSLGPIKGHFFPRAQAQRATALAGSTSIGMH